MNDFLDAIFWVVLYILGTGAIMLMAKAIFGA